MHTMSVQRLWGQSSLVHACKVTVCNAQTAHVQPLYSRSSSMQTTYGTLYTTEHGATHAHSPALLKLSMMGPPLALHPP